MMQFVAAAAAAKTAAAAAVTAVGARWREKPTTEKE